MWSGSVQVTEDALGEAALFEDQFDAADPGLSSTDSGKEFGEDVLHGQRRATINAECSQIGRVVDAGGSTAVNGCLQDVLQIAGVDSKLAFEARAVGSRQFTEQGDDQLR